MKRAAKSILLCMLIAGTFLAGSWYNQRTVARDSTPGGRKVLHYVCPMHPDYTSARPGDAPCCGMRLEPVYAGGGTTAAPGGGNGASSQPAGVVNISLDRQQRIGVQVSRAEKAPATHTLRLFGRVAPDETRVYRLLAGSEGFIRQISTVTTGSQVKKDQWLATFSAPEVRQPMQGFLVTLDVWDRQKQSGPETPMQANLSSASIQVATDRLLNMGLSSVQIEEIRRTREVPTGIRILAPADGFVLARNVSVGQKFERGTEWYRIADLNRIWILADASQKDMKYIRPSQGARVTLASEGTVFSARLSEVLPQFDGNSRTLKVRLEVENPGYALRPDMFVDVELPISLPSAITVPVDAVLDSGTRKTVFVETGEGLFEPRRVETGWRFGDRVQVVKGVEPGERVVTSGNFLLDSESRMKQVAVGVPVKLAGDPVCGMDVDAAMANYHSEHGGRRYVFCSGQCKRKFDQDPGSYLGKAAGDRGRPVLGSKL